MTRHLSQFTILTQHSVGVKNQHWLMYSQATARDFDTRKNILFVIVCWHLTRCSDCFNNRFGEKKTVFLSIFDRSDLRVTKLRDDQTVFCFFAFFLPGDTLSFNCFKNRWDDHQVLQTWHNNTGFEEGEKNCVKMTGLCSLAFCFPVEDSTVFDYLNKKTKKSFPNWISLRRSAYRILTQSALEKKKNPSSVSCSPFFYRMLPKNKWKFKSESTNWLFVSFFIWVNYL